MTTNERIDAGPPVAAAGGVLLLVSLFLDWYEPGISAFTVFEVLDLALAALAIACLLGAAARLGTELPGGRVLGGHLAVFGSIALVLVLSQVVNHPPAAVGRDPDTGLWLGLAGAGLSALGGLLSVTRISLALDVERRGSEGPGPRSPVAPPAGPSSPGGPSAPADPPAPGRGGGPAPGRADTPAGESETKPLWRPPPGGEQR